MSNRRVSTSKVAALTGEDYTRQYESRNEGTMSSSAEVVKGEGRDGGLMSSRNNTLCTVKDQGKLGNGALRQIDHFSYRQEKSMSTKLAVLTSECDNNRIHECDGDNESTGLRRFMSKTGHCYIKRSATQLGRRYVTDIFTTLVDLQWKYNIIIFVLVYTAGWSLFGFFWWLIAYVRGDVDAKISGNDNHTYCVKDVYSYPTAFLFYVETETSIGYGKRAITEECPEAIILFVTQALLGSIVDAFMVGCIYIKLSQPKSGVQTLVFSKTCALARRDNNYCLMFRVANLRNSLLIQCRIRAKLVRSKKTREGENILLHQDDINLGFDTGADNIFLVTPLIICHVIDRRSPFYGLNADDLKIKKFEIIVILEGIVESTGMICQARTSYLNSEISWGHRFMPVLFHARGHFSVDHSAFHTTYDVHMPSYSMSRFDELNGDFENDKTDPSLHSLTASKGLVASDANSSVPLSFPGSQRIKAL